MSRVLFVILLAAACDQPMKQFSESKADLARVEVRKLASEALPQWMIANPSKECPASIDGFLTYTSLKKNADPWGTPYKLFCGANLPPGAKFAAALSFGPDRKEGTPDDIRSWD